MTWLTRALSSSIGKKYLMAVTGLLLCGFLVAHLAGNLLMLVGPKAYNTYAHTLHSQEWFVKLMEVGLLAVFLLHLGLAFSLSRQNKAARGNRAYSVKRHKEGAEHNAPAGVDSWMLVSGLIVLAFIGLHLTDFTFELSGSEFYEGKEPYEKAVALLSVNWRAGVYIIGCLFLCAHLLHGFASAFKSLGISHPKYSPIIQVVGYLFAIVFGLGFVTFPVFAIWGFFG